jgi:hypothetical protein
MSITKRLQKKELKIASEHPNWKRTMPFTISGNISIQRLTKDAGRIQKSYKKNHPDNQDGFFLFTRN